MLTVEEMFVFGVLGAISILIILIVVYVRQSFKSDTTLMDGFLKSLQKNADESEEEDITAESSVDSQFLGNDFRNDLDHGGVSLDLEVEEIGIIEDDTTGTVRPAPNKMSLSNRIKKLLPKKQEAKRPEPSKSGSPGPFAGIMAVSGSIFKPKSKSGPVKQKMEDIDNELDALITDIRKEEPSEIEKMKRKNSVLYKGIFNRMAARIEGLFNIVNKNDMKSVDDELNNVLHESQYILKDNAGAEQGIELATKGESITDLDKAIRSSEQRLPNIETQESKFELPLGGGLLDAMDASPMPEMETPEVTQDMSFEKVDDILSELEESTKVEKDVALDIMRDLKGKAITCEDLESELTDILEHFKSRSGTTKKSKA
ncbi:hypothetical protein CUJ83_13660 [Methanocella sp. CWC-04]|uniref:Uncharacterized protein n=2 Tax=Methanooceanicella nereidis TaxID=2052831 RepID=A0AAP2RG91_9EURY|nr:hypothetical protein [Methanocella sp. CWC-04]